jgi:hypothetical protein
MLRVPYILLIYKDIPPFKVAAGPRRIVLGSGEPPEFDLLERNLLPFSASSIMA